MNGSTVLAAGRGTRYHVLATGPLRVAMARRGMSRARDLERAGVDQATAGRALGRHRVTTATLQKVARALGLHETELIAETVVASIALDSEAVRRELWRLHWRQADLARAASVNKATISRALRGLALVGPAALERIAAALGVRPEELIA